MTGLKKLLSFGKSSKKPPAPNPEHSAESSGDVVQKIDVTGIDPEKLMAKLKLRFGSEFEIYMMHDTYHITAPDRLTADDIEQCR